MNFFQSICIRHTHFSSLIQHWYNDIHVDVQHEITSVIFFFCLNLQWLCSCVWETAAVNAYSVCIKYCAIWNVFHHLDGIAFLSESRVCDANVDLLNSAHSTAKFIAKKQHFCRKETIKFYVCSWMMFSLFRLAPVNAFFWDVPRIATNWISPFWDWYLLGLCVDRSIIKIFLLFWKSFALSIRDENTVYRFRIIYSIKHVYVRALIKAENHLMNFDTLKTRLPGFFSPYTTYRDVYGMVGMWATTETQREWVYMWNEI